MIAIFNRVLILLQDKCISMNGETLSELGLEAPTRSDFRELDRDILQEKNYNIDELQRFVDNTKPLLVDDQRLAFNRITLGFDPRASRKMSSLRLFLYFSHRDFGFDVPQVVNIMAKVLSVEQESMIVMLLTLLYPNVDHFLANQVFGRPL
jgi:hypothetical protein